MNMLNKLSANPQSIWHKTAKAQENSFARNHQWPATNCKYEEEDIAEALRAAIDEYTDKVLRGLGALTQDEIEAKVAEFEAIHAPRNETAESMANFHAKVQTFRAALARLQEIEHREMLIKPAKAAEEEQENIAGFVRSQIIANAPRQI